MAADQRYCLSCGGHRGDRLGFTDAVAIMDPPDTSGSAGRTPPPPPPKHGESLRRWSPTAALITGVALLLLAIGVGILIGRNLHEGSSSGSHVTETITIENGAEAPSSLQGGVDRHGPEGSLRPGGDGGRRKSSEEPAAPEKQSESEEGSKAEEEAEQKTKEALHAKGPLPKSKAKVGEACKKGTPGCGTDKKFNGVFFGAEE